MRLVTLCSSLSRSSEIHPTSELSFHRTSVRVTSSPSNYTVVVVARYLSLCFRNFDFVTCGFNFLMT